MERNKLLTISLLTLVAISAFLFVYDGGIRGGVDDGLFRIPESSVPDRISIARGGDSVVLTRTGKRWLVNGEYDADERRIGLFFAALSRVKPRMALQGVQDDSVSGMLTSNGVTVSVAQEGASLLSFRSAGDAKSFRTWFMPAGEDVPYLVVIPGYRTWLHGLFDARPNSWRSRRLFDFNWRNFVSLEVEFPGTPSAGFKIAQENGMFRVTGMATDTARLNSYLDAVSLAEASEILTLGKKSADSLRVLKTATVLTVKETSGRIHELRLTEGPGAILNGTDAVRLGRNTRQVMQTSKDRLAASKSR